MRSRPKAAITTTVRSRPETSRLSRNEVSPQGDPHRGRRRSDVNQRNGSEALGKGQAPYRARFADWAKSHADQHQGQRDIHFPRQQAEDMTAPEAFAKLNQTLDDGAPSRHDRTRSVREAQPNP